MLAKVVLNLCNSTYILYRISRIDSLKYQNKNNTLQNFLKRYSYKGKHIMFLNVLHILKKRFALSLLYLLIMNNLVVPLFLEKAREIFFLYFFFYFYKNVLIKSVGYFYSLTVSNFIS